MFFSFSFSGFIGKIHMVLLSLILCHPWPLPTLPVTEGSDCFSRGILTQPGPVGTPLRLIMSWKTEFFLLGLVSKHCESGVPKGTGSYLSLDHLFIFVCLFVCLSINHVYIICLPIYLAFSHQCIYTSICLLTCRYI